MISRFHDMKWAKVIVSQNEISSNHFPTITSALYPPNITYAHYHLFCIFLFPFFVPYGSFPFAGQYFWPVLVCLSFVDRCVCPGGWCGWDHRFNHCSGAHAGGHHHRGRNTVLQVGLYLHLRMFHSINSYRTDQILPYQHEKLNRLG